MIVWFEEWMCSKPMENVKVDIWRLSAIVAVSVMFLFSCSRDYISYSREYKVTHSDKPGYFDIIQGKRYRGFIASRSAKNVFDRDTICRFTPSPKEIEKAENILRYKINELEDSLRYRFEALDRYWRIYIGYYGDCDPKDGDKELILRLSLDVENMPESLSYIFSVIAEEAISFFDVYIDLNTGHASIPYFSTSYRPLYIPHVWPSKSKSKNGRIVYEVKEWKPSEK